MLDVHLAHAPDPDALAHLHALLPPNIRVTTGPERPTPAGYHILVAGRPARDDLTTSPNLHTLVIPFAGLPTATRELMRDFPDIAIHNLHHNAPPTAEMAVALLLAAAKQLVPVDRAFRRHDWRPRYEPVPSRLLAGKTALILGYGAVGTRVGTVCRALGMTVLGVRRRADGTQRNVYPVTVLHDLLPRADVLIVALPGTAHTAGLIGADELACLPDGALLVNVGRGDVVDQGALYAALRDGTLFGAGLDVWYTYPPDVEARAHTPPAAVPFHELDNVVLSPHRGGGGGMPAVERLRMTALADLLNRAVRGEPLPHRVDLAAGY
jgi:phosphoglycerate dehydrogenase-like enzyme